MSSLRRVISRWGLESSALALIFLTALVLRFFRLDSFPPGVQHDEVFVSDFAQTILQGHYPIFFDLNRGNEPLFMYLVAVAFKAFGANVWALRATAALCGSAALVVTYLLAREWFPSTSAPPGRESGQQTGGSLVALLTSAGLAFSFWLLYESRVGLHAISTFLLATATFYFFWRGWTRGRPLWLLASGVLAGLSAYTYRSGIFVPLALGVFVVYSLFLHRPIWKNNLRFAPLIFLLAALVYAPLGYYIFSHPESSLARLSDLSGDINAFLAGNPIPLVHNAVAVAGMFGESGDPEWRYNVALRPVFDPLWAILFYGGVVLALWRIKRAPYAFALIWLVVMVLPSVLSSDNPSQHRSVGAIGAAYIFPAILLAAVGDGARRRWNKRASVIFGLGAAALLVLAAFEGIRDYFFIWPANPQVRLIYRADLAAAAHWLDRNDEGEPVLVSAQFANDLDRGSFDLEAGRPHDLHFFSGADTFVVPDKTSALYVDPRSGPIASELKQEFLKTAPVIYNLNGGDNQSELTIYRASAADLAAWRDASPKDAVATSPDGDLSILGAELPASLPSGQRFRVRMWWQVKRPSFADGDSLSWAVRLTDLKHYTWSEAAGLGYTPSQWQPGDDVMSAFDMDIPPDAPPGKYQVSLQLSLRGKVQVFHVNGGIESANLSLGTLDVTRGPVPTSKPDLPVRYPSKARFGETIQLLGSDAVGSVAAGEAWRLVLFWKANGAIQQDYRIRLQAMSEGGEVIATSDEASVAPAYPTHLWRPGEYVRSVHDLDIPGDAASGKAVVRVFLLGPDGKPVGRADGVPVAGIEIGGRARNFTRPSPGHPLAARFGNNIDLIGYDLASIAFRPGQPISVTLYWQARGPADKAYTVFVHTLDSSGKVIGQEDSQPLGGAAPTDTWQEGEYLADKYGLTIAPDAPPGPAALEFGFYDPAAGARLPAFDGSGNPLGDRLLIEGLTIKP